MAYDPHAAGFDTVNEAAYKELFAGDAPLHVQRMVTILTGQNLVRGAVLGKITATGKYILSLSAAGDGSQVPTAILASDANASGGDVQAVIYEAGMFNEDALVLGAAHTIASIRDALRDAGIYMKKNLAG